jgi:hypothetical protein
MMIGRNGERFADVVAENVVTTCEWFRDGRRLPEDERTRIIAELVREISAAMPDGSGAILARACNRILSRVPDRGVPVPRVVGTDMDEGLVRIRPAQAS